MKISGLIPISLVGRNESRQCQAAGAREQGGHFADAADVFRPVFSREAKILVQPMPDVVAIEHVRVQPARVQQVIDGVGNGALAAGTQSREPQNGPFVTVQLTPLLFRNLVFVPGNVGRFLLGHAVCPLNL